VVKRKMSIEGCQHVRGLPGTRPYLSAEQLAELTPWTPDAIEKMIRRGVLVPGVHYFQPFGRRTKLIFKWEAIVALIEGRAAPGFVCAVIPESETRESSDGRVIDVEKATTELQRLLS
jgi:hypothetical protein